MEVLAKPEFLLPAKYIPLDFNHGTQTAVTGGVYLPKRNAGPLKSSRGINFTKSKSKLTDCFKGSSKSNLEANSDFIFYTLSSKSHLQPKRTTVEQRLSLNTHRDRTERINRSIPCWNFNRIECLQMSMVLSWILMAIGMVIYAAARCHQLDGCSYMWTSIEGYVVIAMLAATFLSGAIILVVLTMYRKMEYCEECNNNDVNRMDRESVETQV